jgi:N-acetylglucosamine repressor
MPDPIHGNRELIRAINRSSVLNTIRTMGPISRKEITKHTSLSAATITGITAVLIDEGLVFEKETGDSSGGRRPILLALNKQSRYMIGVKLSVDHITAALTDLEATVLNKRTVQLPSHDLQPTVEALGQVVTDLIVNQEISKDKILGVGIGLAGIVDAENGVLRHSPIYGWRDVPLVDLLQQQLDIPIFLDNDVNTFTLTEKWFGLGSGIDNFLIVTVGRGVGMGMVMNGSLYHGSRGGAGELGHTVIDPSGPLCACGKRGCLEAYASDPAMLNMAAEAYKRGELPQPVKTVEDLLSLAEQGNPAVQKIFRTAGSTLGQGIANLINIFNPELIILSGEGVRYGDHLFKPMREALQGLAMPGLIDDTQIVIDAWDDDAWARGAAGIVLEKLFKFPLQ